jgi:hypothetical protein
MKSESKKLPLQYLISFDKLLRQYDEMARSDNAVLASHAKLVLEAQQPYPELREGFTDVAKLETYKDAIAIVLQDSFSNVLSNNEIKAATLPYDDVIFNASSRFQKILKNAGPGFKPVIRNSYNGGDYLMTATVILKFYYGVKLDFSRPLYYDIPDSEGVMHQYRVLYNADFMEVFPTEHSKELSEEDIDELLEQPDDVELWMSKIPPDSFLAKGFVISNMFDVTNEHAISEIKSELIASDKRGSDTFMTDLQGTFRSFFKMRDLKVGFITYNHKEDQLEKVYGKGIESYLLNGKEQMKSENALCTGCYEKLLQDKQYYVIPDVEKHYKLSEGKPPFKGLYEQGVKSAIFAPIASDGKLLGILEIVSFKKGELNGVNATKLLDVMPYIVSAVTRSKIEEENLIDAIIQHECTTVHSSVLWKFQEEARRFIIDDLEGRQPSFKEVVFKEVFPLYGQVDIKDSSKARNGAIQRDLMIQLSEISGVLNLAFEKNQLPIYEELIFRVEGHIEEIKEVLHTNSEQAIFDFVKEEIQPVFNHLKKINRGLRKEIERYESKIDSGTESYYDHRRNYDESVMRTNKRLAAIIDKRQEDAQLMFPHYFERYKTDGVEHNMYIGDSISEDLPFQPLYLNNLRLWQLQVMCEMENAYYGLKPELPVKLDVTSLILVYNTSLSIRFRMDEKRFDVDGTYNARYEVIKKRIDKSYIKGTDERLTQAGKLCIVYSQKKDEVEYLRYVRYLKSKGYFTDNIDVVELEGLQGVSGLKAIRAEVLYKKGKETEKTYTYEDLIEELKA